MIFATLACLLVVSVVLLVILVKDKRKITVFQKNNEECKVAIQQLEIEKAKLQGELQVLKIIKNSRKIYKMK
ncbi:MAG: hypothetical protein IJT15_01915 [Rickettsiales bacterium]|nr:hypothetical protein [Rickettsiales bacterium]